MTEPRSPFVTITAVLIAPGKTWTDEDLTEIDPDQMRALVNAGAVQFVCGHAGITQEAAAHGADDPADPADTIAGDMPTFLDVATYLTLDDAAREAARLRAATAAATAGRKTGDLYAAEAARLVVEKCPRAAGLRFHTCQAPDGSGLEADVEAVYDADGRVLWGEDVEVDTDDPFWTDEAIEAFETLADLLDDSTVTDRLATAAEYDPDFDSADADLRFADYLTRGA